MFMKWMVSIIILAASGSVWAQNSPTSPQTTSPIATIVRSAEVNAAVSQNTTGAVADSVLRVV